MADSAARSWAGSVAEQKTPFAQPGPVSLDDSFINSMGLVRPRTGQAGVTRAGGVGSAGLSPAPAPQVQAPGLLGAPNGRPPEPKPAPAPGAPASPGQPAAQPTTVTSGPVPGASTVPQPAPEPGVPAQVPGAPQQTDFTGRVFQAARMQFNKLPSRAELIGVDPSVAIDTPYGQMVTNPDTGKRELVFTPEGKQLWGQEVQRLTKAYGPTPAAGLAGAPTPPVEPGRRSYNPFTGMWSS